MNVAFCTLFRAQRHFHTLPLPLPLLLPRQCRCRCRASAPRRAPGLGRRLPGFV